MLRTLVVLLIFANAAYFAWSQGLLREWGLGPRVLTEPHRLEAQIEPQALRILTAEEARGVQTAAARNAQKACLLVAPLDASEAAQFEARLNAVVPPEVWSVEELVLPARWIVYMGPYPDQEALARKVSELKSRGVKVESPRNPSLQPGLSLGAHASRDMAQISLQSLSARGVRTAKVIQEQTESTARSVRMVPADQQQRQEIEALASSLPAGRSFKPC